MGDNGTEADYMHDCQMSQWGAEDDEADPEFEVVNSQNDRMFSGSRAACWDFRRKRGGYVRPWTGYDDADERNQER